MSDMADELVRLEASHQKLLLRLPPDSQPDAISVRNTGNDLFFSKLCKSYSGCVDPLNVIYLGMMLNNVRGDLTDTSAKSKSLLTSSDVFLAEIPLTSPRKLFIFYYV